MPPPALLLDLDTSGRVLDLTYATMGAFSAGELQLLLEGLTRLALQPPLEWMQRLVEALRPQLAGLQVRRGAGALRPRGGVTVTLLVCVCVLNSA